jgi:hypothetical protein
MSENIELVRIMNADIVVEEHGYLLLEIKCDCHGEIKHFRHFDVDAIFLKNLFERCKVQKLSECIGKSVCVSAETFQCVSFYPVVE